VKIHLFGLPLSTHRRLESESNGWDGAVPPPHSFRASPISTNEHVRFTEGEIRDLRAGVSEGFTHIVIPGSRDWKTVQSRFMYDCRVHIARLWEPIRDVRWEDLRLSLHSIAKMDEKWLEQVSPGDLRHALLLPPNVFRTVRSTYGYWRRCDVYVELLAIVDKEHRTPDRGGGRSWIDARKLRYRIDPGKHGRSEADRAGLKSYRFCYEMPPGFHYDVADDKDGMFVIPVQGKPHSLVHCNISPWGHVRNG
jgi:hypothetical protein